MTSRKDITMASNSAPSQATDRPIPGKKYFTVEEANQALPYVSRIVADLVTSYQKVAKLRDRLELPDETDDVDTLRSQFDESLERLQYLSEELSSVGVELKDYERGLLDFPAIYQDREICLCWEHGEETLLAWHELETGYTGRLDIKTLEPNPQ
jgi:hypothetical protein